MLGVALFARLQAAAGTDVTAATANARALQSAERFLHVDIEQAANAWLTDHPILIDPAVYFYRLYYAVLVGVLVWVFVRHAELYVTVRRSLVALTALALPIFWALPRTSST